MLLNDVDIVWADDPFPYIPVDADLVAQTGMMASLKLGFKWKDDAINTGFYFVKANHRTINLMKYVYIKSVITFIFIHTFCDFFERQK